MLSFTKASVLRRHLVSLADTPLRLGIVHVFFDELWTSLPVHEIGTLAGLYAIYITYQAAGGFVEQSLQRLNFLCRVNRYTVGSGGSNIQWPSASLAWIISTQVTGLSRLSRPEDGDNLVP